MNFASVTPHVFIVNPFWRIAEALSIQIQIRATFPEHRDIHWFIRRQMSHFIF